MPSDLRDHGNKTAAFRGRVDSYSVLEDQIIVSTCSPAAYQSAFRRPLPAIIKDSVRNVLLGDLSNTPPAPSNNRGMSALRRKSSHLRTDLSLWWSTIA